MGHKGAVSVTLQSTAGEIPSSVTCYTTVNFKSTWFSSITLCLFSFFIFIHPLHCPNILGEKLSHKREVQLHACGNNPCSLSFFKTPLILPLSSLQIPNIQLFITCASSACFSLKGKHYFLPLQYKVCRLIAPLGES